MRAANSISRSDNARAADRPEAISRTRCNRAVRLRQTIVDVAIRIRKLRRIEQVVRLRPQLELHALRDRKLLEDAEVDDMVTRPEELVTFHVSRAREIRAPAGARRDRRNPEGAGEVRAVVRIAGSSNQAPRHALVADDICTVVDIPIPARIDVERRPAVQHHQAIELPSAQSLIHRLRRLLPKRWPWPNGR